MSFWSRLAGAPPDEDTHDKLRASVQRHEGCVLHPYKDSKGIWTIGWGHNLEADPVLFKNLVDQAGGTIDAVTIAQSTADRLLQNDLALAEDAVHRALPRIEPIDSCRRAVLIEMAFQMGVGGMLGFTQMVKALERHDYARTAQEMLNSKWHRTDSPTRAETLARRMESGVWEA